MNPALQCVAIAVAGGTGAVARYLLDSAFPARIRQRYPWGITTVNLLGSFLIGVLFGSQSMLGQWHDVATIGFLGGFTTFSTAMIDTVRLTEAGRHGAAFGNAFGQCIACVAAALLGMWVTSC
ncbi:fluoride efflux transporter CrcB [Rarobacter faecitabidus]|uniref:Fluoride-specific ion channel FluC n=1 Tax=Rarobacter faecitabidus TaxID=13243 RepID=A0A542ZUJ6_RARFA|nr:CrcB family protein [Rarobacter faecitabidus]TQL64012.1 camphor resistance protein CrcB [Rarobacter faecitabidus]